MSIVDISQIIFNVSASIAALAGLKIYTGKSERLTYSQKYPVEKLNKSFKLVDTEKAPGKIYLIDLKGKTRQWIMSARTFLDLGYSWDQFQRISQEEFDSYTEKHGILTSGIPGR